MQSARQLREKRNYIQRKSSNLVTHLLEDKAAADITRDLLQRESRLTISFTFVIQLIASLTLKKKRRKSVKGNPLLFARMSSSLSVEKRKKRKYTSSSMFFR